jgi:hypothetical protein
MTTDKKKVARRKLSLLELASDLTPTGSPTGAHR